MLKGVHHQIIEIRQTGDPFFERALLFVRPNCEERSEEEWQEKGCLFLRQTKPYSGLRKSRLLHRLRVLAYVVGGGIGGVIVGAMASKMG